MGYFGGSNSIQKQYEGLLEFIGLGAIEYDLREVYSCVGPLYLPKQEVIACA